MIVRHESRPKPLRKDYMFERSISLEKLPLLGCVRGQAFATSTRPGMRHGAAIFNREIAAFCFPLAGGVVEFRKQSCLLPAESNDEIAKPLTAILFWGGEDGLFRV